MAAAELADFLAELRDRTPLDVIIGRRVRLTGRGGNRKGCCPFHGEKRPSFHVYDDHFHCFGCGAHGDAIEYVQRAEGVGFHAAVEQLAGEAGMTLPDGWRGRPACPVTPEETAKRERQAQKAALIRARLQAKTDAHDQAAIAEARAIALGVEPVEDTPAERYLIGTEPGQRHIPKPTEWPACLGYHPARQALVAIATDANGEVVGVQEIRITADGLKCTGSDGRVKNTTGKPSYGAVRLPRRSNSTAGWRMLDVAEGVETGLSVWMAEGAECHIGLGRFAPQVGRINRIITDDDAAGSPRADAVAGWIKGWREAGLDIQSVTPFETPRGLKQDFNDVLQAGGVPAVRARLLAARGLSVCSPPRALPNASLVDVHADLAATVRAFYSATVGLDAPQILMRGQGGSGKTDAVVRLMTDAITTARAASRPHRLLYLLPEHVTLGPQVEARLRKLGLNVAILRGRGDPFALPNPAQPPPCSRHDALREAMLAGARPGQAVCKSDKQVCPSFTGCRYQADVAAAAAADIVIAASNYVFDPLPAGVRKGLGWVVIDEAFADRGDSIRAVTVESFSPASLARAPVLTKGETDAIWTSRLGWLDEKMQAATAGAADGYPDAARLQEAGLTPDLCQEAIRLTFRRKREPNMNPAMSLEDLRKETARCGANRSLPAIAAAWAAAADMLREGKAAAGRLRVETRESRRGTTRSLIVHGQRSIQEWLHEMPVLLLDATGTPEAVRRFFPRVVERTPNRVAAPYAHTRLVLGGFAKGTLSRHPRRLAELRALLAVENLGEDLGIVTHKSTVAGLSGLGARMAWHGANAGDDDFKKVGAMAIVGAPSAKPSDIAALAAARTGFAVPIEKAVETTAPVLMTDGSGVMVPVLAYAHPAAQAVHASIHNAALDQAAHRPRQILRTEASPVTTSIFGNAAPGIPVDCVVNWAEVRPDRLMMMVASKYVHANAADMAALHPSLFRSEKAASAARGRFGPDWIQRLKGMIARDRQPWSRVRWQPAGQGQDTRWSWCPTAELAAMRKAIEAKRGKLVHWHAEVWTHGRRSREDIPATVLTFQTGMGMSSSAAMPAAWLPRGDSPNPRQARPPDG